MRLRMQKDPSADTHTSSMILRCTQCLPTPPGHPLGGRREAKHNFYPLILPLFLLFFSAHLVKHVESAPPKFYEHFRVALLQLPDTTEKNTVISRVRARDPERDYPLRFSIDAIGRNVVYLNQHNCSRSSNIMCEADIYLGRDIEAGRFYTFDLKVTDTTGASTSVRARIHGTSGRVTPISDIFLKYSPAIRVKEDRPPLTVISTMIVRKKDMSPFGELHILGDPTNSFKVNPGNLVSSQSINASIVLQNKLDYDTSNIHLFQVCQLHPYTNEEVDTRNIACVAVAVLVEDVQDLPPIFFLAPPISRVPLVAVPGDEVATVGAEDMDKGAPREIRYSILPASSLYTEYFAIDERTGVITMQESAEVIRDKMVSLDPILMTVTAEEVITETDEYPSLATSVEIAFVVLDAEILIPKFVHEKYVGEVYEDALPDTEVFVNGSFFVQGLKGLFSLELDGGEDMFIVQPNVVKDTAQIKLKTRNSFMLDHETRPQVTFKLIARQVRGPQQVTGSAEITVKVLDTNDNIPVFSQNPYVSEIFENATRGTEITRVFATDDDTGPFGAVRYTAIVGPLQDRLYLHPTTGVITLVTNNHQFDRETASEYILTVEAKDNNGHGAQANVASTKIVIRIKDVNDSPPKFLESIYKGVLASDQMRLQDPIRVRATDQDAERPNNEVEYDIEDSTYSVYFHIHRFSGVLDMKQNFPVALQMKSGMNQTEEHIRRKRQLDDESIINLRVVATDRGYPPLQGSVDVKIFKQEFGERVFKFFYPQSKDQVLKNRKHIVSTLNELTGGETEIKDVRPRRTGYLGTNIDPDRSEVTAIVRFGMSTVVDLEKVLSNMNNTEVHQLRTDKLESQKVIKEIEGQNYSYLVGVVFLCLILATIILIILLCCLVEGCPLYKDRKKYNMVSDDGSEGISYIRVDENGKYKRNPEGEGPTWWDSMPRFMKNVFLMFGYAPSERNNSRLAWSADERQRYWKMNHAPDDGLVADRPPMMRPRNPRDAVLLEDLDDGRYQRERLHRQGAYPRVESRTSQSSQEVRRVFLLKNAKEMAAKRGDLREGEMYLIEDIDENAPTARMEDGRPGNIMVHQDEDYQYPRPGNAELLRLHASPRDAVYFNGQMRRVRRAGVESEGTVLLQEDPGGGLSSRLIEGQSVGQTPRSHREYYIDDRRGHDHRYANNASPSQSDAYIQTEENYASRKRIKSPIQEETRSLLDAERRSFKDKNKTKKPQRPNIERLNDDDQRSKSSKSTRSANIPGTYGYQHTKTSILRYESNKAKLEEDREEMIRQGKDPDTCNHTGSVSAEFSSLNTVSRSASKLEGRRSQSQNTLAGSTVSHSERRGSLPEVETTIEKEAARRILVRRNSTGDYERYEEIPVDYQEVMVHQTPVREQVIFVNEAEHAEDIERRRHQRRTEASEAISEQLVRRNGDGGEMQISQDQIGGHSSVPSELIEVHGSNRVSHLVANESVNNASVPSHLRQSNLVVNGGNTETSSNVARNTNHSNEHTNQVNVSNNQNALRSEPNAANNTENRNGGTTDGRNSNVEQASDAANHATRSSTNTLQVANQSEHSTSVSESNAETVSSLDKSGRSSNLMATSNATSRTGNETVSDRSSRASESVAVHSSQVVRTSSQEENNNIINQQNIETGEGDSNLPDDVKVKSANSAYREQYERKEETLRIMEEEMKLGVTKSSKIFEKNSRNDKSMLNIPNNRKRSKMLEKKSVFTIAYDGMKTDQLRPESAPKEP